MSILLDFGADAV